MCLEAQSCVFSTYSVKELKLLKWKKISYLQKAESHLRYERTEVTEFAFVSTQFPACFSRSLLSPPPECFQIAYSINCSCFLHFWLALIRCFSYGRKKIFWLVLIPTNNIKVIKIQQGRALYISPRSKAKINSLNSLRNRYIFLTFIQFFSFF